MPSHLKHPRGTLAVGVALALGAVAMTAGTAPGPTVQAAQSSPVQGPPTGNGAGGGNSGNGVGNGPSGAAAPAKSLVLTSSVDGAVRPGAPAQLRVRIENANSQAVWLRSVTGTVTQVTSPAGTGPACQAGDFVVSSFTAPTGTRRVLKGGSTTVDLVISLRDTAANQDRCKGATYAFDVRATADQA